MDSGKMSYWIIVACIFSAIILLITSNLKKNRKNLPPGPRALPVIGNLHQLGSRPHRAMFELSKKYGPLIYLKLGSVPTVVLSSPETAKEALKTYDVQCCNRPRLACPSRITFNQHDLTFSPYNEYWRELRKMSMIELYSSKRVQSFQHIRGEEVALFVEFVKQSALSGTPVNLSRKLMGLSGSVICRIAFGMNLRGTKLEHKYEDVVLRGMELAGSLSAEDLFPSFGWIIDRLSGSYNRCEKLFKDLDEFFEEAIEFHIEKKSEEGKEDIIDSLLKMEKEQLGLGQFQLTRNHIKGIFVDFIMAGIDTSAQLLTWVMTRLIANPRVMRKVQAEVRQHIKNKDNISDEGVINHLEYLRMVIKETFRINPVLPLLIPREAMADFKINGYDVPKKTQIQVNTWALGHDPNVWIDPEEFLPERFMDCNIEYHGQNFEFLPFGSGRRMCPGLGMGMALVHLTLINLLYRFDWKLPEGMKTEDLDLDEAYALLSHKKVPLQLVPVRTQWT